MNITEVIQHTNTVEKTAAGGAILAALVAISDMLPTIFGSVSGFLSIVLVLYLIYKARVSIAREKVTKERENIAKQREEIELAHAKRRRKGDS